MEATKLVTCTAINRTRNGTGENNRKGKKCRRKVTVCVLESEVSGKPLCYQHREQFADKIAATTNPKTASGTQCESSPQPVQRHSPRRSPKPKDSAVMGSSSPETKIQSATRDEPEDSGVSELSETADEQEELLSQDGQEAGGHEPEDEQKAGGFETDSNVDDSAIDMSYHSCGEFPEVREPPGSRDLLVEPAEERESPKEGASLVESESPEQDFDDEGLAGCGDNSSSMETGAPALALLTPPRVKAALASAPQKLERVSESTSPKTQSDPSPTRATRGISPVVERKIEEMWIASKEENSGQRIYIAISRYMGECQWKIKTNEKGEIRLKIGESTELRDRRRRLWNSCRLEVIWSLKVMNCKALEKEVFKAINDKIESKDPAPFWRGLQKETGKCASPKCHYNHKEVYLAKDLELKPLQDLMRMFQQQELHEFEKARKSDFMSL